MSSNEEERYIIVGGGIAGMMTALKLVEQHKRSHGGGLPAITVIDSEKEVAQALSGGNGGSLRADEFGVLELNSPPIIGISSRRRWRKMA